MTEGSTPRALPGPGALDGREVEARGPTTGPGRLQEPRRSTSSQHTSEWTRMRQSKALFEAHEASCAAMRAMQQLRAPAAGGGVGGGGNLRATGSGPLPDYGPFGGGSDSGEDYGASSRRNSARRGGSGRSRQQPAGAAAHAPLSPLGGGSGQSQVHHSRNVHGHGAVSGRVSSSSGSNYGSPRRSVGTGDGNGGQRHRSGKSHTRRRRVPGAAGPAAAAAVVSPAAAQRNTAGSETMVAALAQMRARIESLEGELQERESSLIEAQISRLNLESSNCALQQALADARRQRAQLEAALFAAEPVGLFPSGPVVHATWSHPLSDILGEEDEGAGRSGSEGGEYPGQRA